MCARPQSPTNCAPPTPHLPGCPWLAPTTAVAPFSQLFVLQVPSLDSLASERMCSLHPVSLQSIQGREEMGPGHNILSACNKTENVHSLCLQLVSWRICRACSQLCSFPIALLPSAADCNKTLCSESTWPYDRIATCVTFAFPNRLHAFS